MLTVHLRINDAATGKPTPARVRVSEADGTNYAPLGRYVECPTRRNESVGGQLAIGKERWFYTNGSFEIPLPSGVPLRVQATKGPQYLPLDTTASLGSGQMALRFAMERWADTRTEGWLSGDSRCHFLSPHAALLEAEAEDLDVVNLLAALQPYPSLDGTAYSTVPNLDAFSGQQPALTHRDRTVVVNTLNTHPVLGSVGLLNSHRPVYPLTFGGDEADDWSICDWCDQCHRKGGMTIWTDPFEPSSGLMGGEALIAAILGKIDAIEVSPQPRSVPLLLWVYRLWNAGFTIPLVGGSGKDSNRIALGSMRTYARPATNPEHSFTEPHRQWVEAVRGGFTYITAGPLLNLTRDGDRVRVVGQTFNSPASLELIVNGRILATGVGEIEHTLTEPGWCAARTAAGGDFAHTSPVVVGHREPHRESRLSLRKLIEQTRDWATEHGRYANPKRREQLLARCDETIAKLGSSS